MLRQRNGPTTLRAATVTFQQSAWTTNFVSSEIEDVDKQHCNQPPDLMGSWDIRYNYINAGLDAVWFPLTDCLTVRRSCPLGPEAP